MDLKLEKNIPAAILSIYYIEVKCLYGESRNQRNKVFLHTLIGYSRITEHILNLLMRTFLRTFLLKKFIFYCKESFYIHFLLLTLLEPEARRKKQDFFREEL